MNVALRWFQRSPILGHIASSHTVCRRCSRTRRFKAERLAGSSHAQPWGLALWEVGFTGLSLLLSLSGTSQHLAARSLRFRCILDFPRRRSRIISAMILMQISSGESAPMLRPTGASLVRYAWAIPFASRRCHLRNFTLAADHPNAWRAWRHKDLFQNALVVLLTRDQNHVIVLGEVKPLRSSNPSRWLRPPRENVLD
jgi:hypothetical protein